MSGGSDAQHLARRRRAQGVATNFDGSRLALARRLARMPRARLAREVGVTPTAIAQYERGGRPTAPIQAALALRLGVPEEFFRQGRPVRMLPAESAHFRSLRATPALSRDQAVAFATLAADVVDVLEQYVDLPSLDLPDLELPSAPTREAIASAAAEARAALGVAGGPVPHMVRLLESRGVVVLRMPDAVAGQALDAGMDAFSTAAPERPLVLLSSKKEDKARSRFDAAHELGHLLIHHDAEPGNKVVESQAQTFAAEFLMPEDEVIEDLPRRLDWDQLHRAKKRWGCSLRSLVYRARTLGVFSESMHRRASVQLNAMGLPEPGHLGPPESPSLLGAAIELLAESGTSMDDLADAAQLPMAQFEAVIGAGTDERPKLQLDPRHG